MPAAAFKILKKVFALEEKYVAEMTRLTQMTRLRLTLTRVWLTQVPLTQVPLTQVTLTQVTLTQVRFRA